MLLILFSLHTSESLEYCLLVLQYEELFQFLYLLADFHDSILVFISNLIFEL